MIRNKLSRYWHLLRASEIRDNLWNSDVVSDMPSYIGIAVEEQCFFRCKHCNIWKTEKHHNTLILDEQKGVVKHIHEWLGSRASIALSGGEPFLNPNTIPLIKYAKKLGLSVSTTSNAYLINEKKAYEIIQSGLNSLILSLDFPDKKRQDIFKGHIDAFKHVVSAIGFLRSQNAKRSVKIYMNTVIMRQNLTLLPSMVQLSQRLGFDGISFQPIYETFASPTHKEDWYRRVDLWPEDKIKIVDTFNTLISMKKQRHAINNTVTQLETYKSYFTDYQLFVRSSRCYTGISNFLIDVYGNVRLCYFFPPIGNIIHDRPEKIWNNRSAQHTRQMCRLCQRGCRVLLCNTTYSKKEIISLAWGKIQEKIYTA